MKLRISLLMVSPDELLSIGRAHAMFILVVRLDLCTLDASEATELTRVGLTISMSPHVSPQCGIVGEGSVTYATPTTHQGNNY